MRNIDHRESLRRIGRKKGERNSSFRDSLDALTIYESRFKFLFFIRRLMSERGKERKEMADVVGKKKLTKLIAVFAVNGNGDHLLAVKFRAISLSIPDSS